MKKEKERVSTSENQTWAARLRDQCTTTVLCILSLSRDAEINYNYSNTPICSHIGRTGSWMEIADDRIEWLYTLGVVKNYAKHYAQ